MRLFKGFIAMIKTILCILFVPLIAGFFATALPAKEHAGSRPSRVGLLRRDRVNS